MNKRKILLSVIIILTILSAIVFTSCGMSVADENNSNSNGYNYNNEEPAMDYDSNYDDNGKYVDSEPTYFDDDGVTGEKKMIWSGYARLEVEKYNDAYSAIKSFLGETGYIQDERVETNTYYVNQEPVKARSGYITIRIEHQRFETLMDYFYDLGEVENRNKSVNNITDQYRDNEARIELLEDEKARLQEFLDKETYPENVFQYHSRLTEIQYEIESLKGTLVKWDNLVSYSVVNIDIREKIEGLDQNVKDDTFWEKLGKSFKQGWEVLQSVVIFILSAIPVLLLLGGLALLIIFIIKVSIRISRRKKK